MAKILITGATGNVGKETVRFVSEMGGGPDVTICMRDVNARHAVSDLCPDARKTTFDFENPGTYDKAFRNTDILFLLRPPHIADAEGVFRPLLESAKKNGINKVVFLSVQGADKNKQIPHAKIEKIIRELDFDHVFLRPSYFMQNFTTTLMQDVQEGTVVLPAGNALFNWVDVANVGEVAAHVLTGFERFANRAIEITGNENKSFAEAIEDINRTVGSSLKYKSVGLLRFYRHKKRQGIPRPMIMVMIMLHFLPRFQKPPHVSDSFFSITGRQPNTIADFAKAEKDKFSPGVPNLGRTKS